MEYLNNNMTIEGEASKMMLIRTPYGDTYKIHGNGDIERTDIRGFIPSGDWKMKGIEHVKRRDFIPFERLKEMNLESFQWTWKNGNPQWTVRDLDHGTTRTWGNTKYHGIKFISTI
jgi:hypothetical protein